MDSNQIRKRIDKVLSIDEIDTIEYELKRKIIRVLFDSMTNQWNIESRDFLNQLMNRSHFIIIIETMSGKKIGCYIETFISQFDQYLSDPKAFVFHLNFASDNAI